MIDLNYRERQKKIDYILSLMLDKDLILNSSLSEFKKRLERKTDEWLIDYLERVREIKEIKK